MKTIKKIMLFPKLRELEVKELEKQYFNRPRKMKNELAKLDKRFETIENAVIPKVITVTIEWNKNKTWGNCPKATVRTSGNVFNSFESSRITGCGYCKESTAFAEAVNQVNGILKRLYSKKEKHPRTKNHKLFGYGSGYYNLPYFEGGVGVSCYPDIFKSMGYKMRHISGGKTFDVWEITKRWIK